MCLILFAWRAHPRYRLVMAANRDEFHQRPTAAAGFWSDHPDLLAGRDLQAGGTWLGVTRSGRFAAVTNFREPVTPEVPLEHSRGSLVTDYLTGTRDPAAHARGVLASGPEYRGFSLLLGDADGLVYVSNRDGTPLPVDAGCHGLSNHRLDTDWPKVRSGRRRLERLLDGEEIQADSLLDMLTDRGQAPGVMPTRLDDEAVRRHLMDHFFILSPVYGTRSSTVLLIQLDGRAEFVERRFAADGSDSGTGRFAFRIHLTEE
jgi:uncharacterized protein with NRDE domain